jgi:hypothetical protein
MKLIACIIAGLLFTTFASSQMLKGKISDMNGDQIASASVYIKEIKQGVICDKDGNFQIKLTPGTYNLECSCLG